MFWYKDEWDEAYADLVYGNEEIELEEDETAMYFDVPIEYRPL